MSGNQSALFGSGGVPIGAILAGQFAADPNYLPCDGKDYLKSAYPALDTTGFTTFGSNQLTQQALPASKLWSAVAFGNGVFVAVNRSAGDTVAASSTDGLSWTSRTIPPGAYTSVIYAAGLFVAVGSSICSTSPDGINWTQRTFTGINDPNVAYGAGLFVAVQSSTSGTPSNSYRTSPDGITWTTRNLPNNPTNYIWGGVKWDARSGLFILVTNLDAGAATWLNVIYTSMDGITWKWSSYGPAAADNSSIQPFGDKWYVMSGASLLTTETRAQYVAGTTFGWELVGLKGRAASYASLFKAGEWLGINDSETLYLTKDGTRFDILLLPVPLSYTTQSAVAAFGNNTFVFLPRFSGVYGSVFTVQVDATKFRVPNVRPVNEADRLYIKAK